MQQKKGIISLITVLVIGFLGLSLVLAVAFLALVGLGKNYDRKFGEKTFYSADTVLKEAVLQYQNSNGTIASGKLSSINNISEGNISFNIGPSSNGWQYRKIEATALNNSPNLRPFKRTLQGEFILNPSYKAFEYAIFSDGKLEIKGTTGISITGDIFSNSEIDCKGNTTIGGEVFALNVGSKCSGTKVNTNIATISPPSINISNYISFATCTSTASKVKNDCLNDLPTNGIIFVDDPAKETKLQNIQLNGVLVIKGNLWLSGGNSITETNNHPAIIVEGNLKFTGNNTINGLIYVTGETTFGGGNVVINGSVLSVGGAETEIGGSVTINYQKPTNPPSGLNPELKPKLVSWFE